MLYKVLVAGKYIKLCENNKVSLVGDIRKACVLNDKELETLKNNLGFHIPKADTEEDFVLMNEELKIYAINNEILERRMKIV